MSKTVHLKNGSEVILELKPFASGGEGSLYKIIIPSSFKNSVAKIYKPEKRTTEKENKINFLSANPPIIQAQDGHNSFIWINQVIYENGKFCGFLMPLAHGEKLELLCHPTLPQSLNSDWKKFDFQAQDSIKLRLNLCFNIAVALYCIHRLKNYVLIDMKPENIMVQSNGLISLIDIDSVAVIKDNKTIYPAPVATPEYTPPEYYKGTKPDKDGINDTWDRFSMAVIFYRLLCGIHPFIGTCNTPFEQCHALAEMVQNGLFPNGIKGSYFKVIPPPHRNFKNLEKVIQGLFIRCFDDGFKNPQMRPTPDDWCRIFSPQQLIQINRPLPSTFVFFPKYISSKAIVYNPTTDIEIPLVKYVNPPRPNILKNLLGGIFGKSQQQLLIDDLIKRESVIKIQEKRFDFFATELRNILQEFQKYQESILNDEISEVEDLKNSYVMQQTKYDQEAKEFHLQEADEMKKLIASLTSSLNEFDIKIKESYSNILSKKFEKHEIEKITAQNNLQNMLIQEQTEINRLVNNPDKLSKYTIASASIYNFGNSTKNSLALAGIKTAADFIDISRDGDFKNRFGKWVKAHGIGWNRAYDLREWKRNLELKENQAITLLIKSNFKNRILFLENAIKNIELGFKEIIQPFQIQYNKERANYELEKHRLNDKHEENMTQIKNKYDSLHLALKTKVKKYVDTVVQNKMTDIALQIDNQLNKNFQEKMAVFASKKSEIKNYAAEFQIEIVNLLKLQQSLTS